MFKKIFTSEREKKKMKLIKFNERYDYTSMKGTALTHFKLIMTNSWCKHMFIGIDFGVVFENSQLGFFLYQSYSLENGVEQGGVLYFCVKTLEFFLDCWPNIFGWTNQFQENSNNRSHQMLTQQFSINRGKKKFN